MSESVLLSSVLLSCSKGFTRLFRNNCGVWKDRSGRYVKYGVANPGGSDLIGYTTVIVTPDMIGQRLAIFTAIEGKFGRNKPTPEQESFVNAVLAAGGRAGVAYSVQDAERIISGEQNICS